MSSSVKVHPADAIFVAAVILVAAVCAFVGIAMPLGSFAADTFFLLANAYRVAGGQVPHVDFSSPWGPVIFLIEATGLHLSGMRPSGLGYANAVFGPLIATWAFLIARARWSPVVACVIGVYTLLLIAAPFSLGLKPTDFSYAMVYNRYAYALLGIVLLECAGDMLSANAGARKGAALAVSTGVALGLLVFLKVSYAFVAIAFVAVLPIAGTAGGMRRLAWLWGSFAFLLVLGLSYLRFDVPDMLHDLTMAANSRAISLQPATFVRIFGWENAALLILAALVARYRGVFVALLTIAAGGLVLITNQQLGGFPLNAYAAVALISTCAPNAGKMLTWPTGVALITAICVLPVYELSTISLISAAIERHRPQQRVVAVLAMPERGTLLTFTHLRGWKQDENYLIKYLADLSDGLELVRSRGNKNEGVLSFEEFNTFNYALGLPPPRGGFAAAAYDYIFDDAVHPSPQRFFGNASYVMVPNYAAGSDPGDKDPNTLALLRLYGGVLRAQFRVVAQSKHWVLWHRDQAR